MKVGGVQKSLYNLLWSLDTKEQYEITLLLFSKVGPYIDTLPDSVKIVECGKMFRYLGISQKECEKNLKDKLIRGVLAAISRIFGRSTALRPMLAGQPMLNGIYDVAISYLHNGRRKSFYGGVQEYVLERVQAKRKIAFLHGDYKNCGADHPENNRVLERFDCIAACSDGCRKVLEDTLPCLKEKCVTVQNCHRFDEFRTMAADNPLKYNEAEVNVENVFGQLNLYFPSTWRLQVNKQSVFGGVKICGRPCTNPDAPVIHMNAESVFGNITIFFE